MSPNLFFAFIMRQWSFLFLCVILLFARPAEAQPPDSSRSDPVAPTIVVTGSQLTREQMRERAVDDVRNVGVARGQRPAARWIDPVCPRVLGIAEPYAEIVEARMRAIAQETGIRIAAGCAGNISVSFVGDAKALMNILDQRSGLPPVSWTRG